MVTLNNLEPRNYFDIMNRLRVKKSVTHTWTDRQSCSKCRQCTLHVCALYLIISTNQLLYYVSFSHHAHSNQVYDINLLLCSYHLYDLQ